MTTADRSVSDFLTVNLHCQLSWTLKNHLGGWGVASLVASVRAFPERLAEGWLRPTLDVGDTISWIRGEDEMKRIKETAIKERYSLLYFLAEI